MQSSLVRDYASSDATTLTVERKNRSKTKLAVLLLGVVLSGVVLVTVVARNHSRDPSEGPGHLSMKTRLVGALSDYAPFLVGEDSVSIYGPYFEGDLRIPDGQKEEAYGSGVGVAKLLTHPLARPVGPDGLTSIAAKKWTDGIVYYTLNSNLRSSMRDNYIWAMRHIECHVPGVFFRQRSSQANYISIERDTDAVGYCYSTSIGMRGGKQKIGGDSCGKGTAAHELLHAIGFWHEQSRPDRDGFVNIHLENVKDGFSHNFNTRSSIDSRSYPYDYRSLMQYRSKAFSKNGKKTITSKNGETLGQYNGMTGNDVQQCRAMYQPDASKVYFIKSVKSGKVLDVKGASRSNKKNIQQYSKHGGRNQQWIIPALGQWVTVKNVNSGLYMDIKGRSTKNGGNLQQYYFHGGTNQQFKFTSVGSGQYKIEVRHSGKVLDVKKASTKNGANVQQYSYHGGTNQKWRLETVPTRSDIYFISSKKSGKVFDVKRASKKNKKNIQQYGLHGKANQQWIIPSLSGSYVNVKNVNSGKCMDIKGGTGSKSNGDNLQQYSCHNNGNQKFKFEHVSGEYYRIKVQHSGKCLDVKGASMKNGANIYQWTCHGGDNQLWKIVNMPPF